ncbi:hypothetical protein [Actinophytocola sp.]|uniref:hypothetical protein n=1 Tax=Actinophytocola sp. TaxID=1872138 RepID=UPI002D49A842|nr:hypothetical protein [Actinophytocola sp.]HYQ61662.1 hypothetical protein [Actinophytocola sp.]
MEPPGGENDPYRSVWQMSQVGGTGGRRDRRIRWLPGILTGLAVFVPFGLVVVMWEFTGVAVAVLIIGLSIAVTVGGYVATGEE